MSYLPSAVWPQSSKVTHIHEVSVSNYCTLTAARVNRSLEKLHLSWSSSSILIRPTLLRSIWTCGVKRCNKAVSWHLFHPISDQKSELARQEFCLIEAKCFGVVLSCSLVSFLLFKYCLRNICTLDSRRIHAKKKKKPFSLLFLPSSHLFSLLQFTACWPSFIASKLYWRYHHMVMFQILTVTEWPNKNQ